MRTRATLLDLAPSENTTTDNHLVLTLVGEDNNSQRPKVGIVPVVDRSGSMAAQQKLRIVTGALGYLAGYLSADDHLALVAFDTTVDTLLPATRATPAGARGFTEALSSLHPRASTNLSGGIAAGLAAAAAMPADTLVRVIVLTDGQANCGDDSRTGLLALLSDIPSHVSVSFLGVGTDCDHDLLGALASAGRGNYGFVEAASRAADVLGAEVGGLLDTEVHQLKVTVTAKVKYAQLGGVLSHPAEHDDCGKVEVHLGTLLVGQTRHLVFPMTLLGPKRRHARPVTVADVTITGVIDDTDIRVELLPKAHFGGPAVEADPDVVTAVELAQVAVVQQTAEAAVAVGDFDQARRAFAGLNVNSGAALGLSQQLAGNYNDRQTYGASATLRSSSSHALRGSLSGSGVVFDALAARTIGSYTTAGQRDVASATTQATTRAGGMSSTAGTPAVVEDLESGGSLAAGLGSAALGFTQANVTLAGGSLRPVTPGTTDGVSTSSNMAGAAASQSSSGAGRVRTPDGADPDEDGLAGAGVLR